MAGRNSFSGAVPLGGTRRQPEPEKLDAKEGVIELSRLTYGTYKELCKLTAINADLADNVNRLVAHLVGEKPAFPHIPAVSPTQDGAFGVFCLGCSDAEGDYTYPCKLAPDDPLSPPARLVPAPEFIERAPTASASD